MKKYRTLMSFAEDSHARTFLALEKEPGFMPKGRGSGGKCSGSFAWFDRDTSLWRTWQRCLTGGLMKFLGRWPKAGMMQNGKCYQLKCLVGSTKENAPSLWPTPRACHAMAHKMMTTFRALGRPYGASNLEDKLTLNLLDQKQSLDGLYMNPQWVEWLMGYPEDYTLIDFMLLETQ